MYVPVVGSLDRFTVPLAVIDALFNCDPSGA